MDEIWLPVPAYEGYYEASSFERIRSLDRVIVDSRGQRRALRGKLIHPACNQGHDPLIILSRDGEQFSVRASTIIDRTFFGAILASA